MAHDHDLDEVEEHDRGLSHDLPTLLSRPGGGPGGVRDQRRW